VLYPLVEHVGQLEHIHSGLIANEILQQLVLGEAVDKQLTNKK